jgi:SAM-dependent methyltransferase
MARLAALHTDAGKYELGMGAWSRTLAPLFLDFAGCIQEGSHVLDVGCGTGSLMFTAARTTEASRIIGVDPSDGYLEFARAKNPYPHVAFNIGVADALPYGDACFDVCISLLMLQFVPNARQTVQEMARVTKAYGRVASCMWDNEGGLEYAAKFWNAARALDPDVKGPGDRRYGSPNSLADLWSSSGLRNVETTALVIQMEFCSIDDLWQRQSQSQGPMKPYLSSLSDDRRQALKARLHEDILGDCADRPFALQGKAWAVKGMVPPK